MQCFKLTGFRVSSANSRSLSRGGAAAFCAAGLREHALAGPLKALPTHLDPNMEPQ